MKTMAACSRTRARAPSPVQTAHSTYQLPPARVARALSRAPPFRCTAWFSGPGEGRATRLTLQACVCMRERGPFILLHLLCERERG